MVSVVMAVYNGALYLEKQLDSIRCQTVPPDEVVFCDDCSTDDTPELIRQYIRKYGLQNWHLYQNEQNLGYYQNFFKAVFLANGDTIYLSDQDDIWDPDKIRVFENIYRKHPEISMLQSNISFIDGNGDPIQNDKPYHGIRYKGKCVRLNMMTMCKYQGSGFTMSFRRSVAELIRNDNLHQYEDIYKFHDILIGLMAAAVGKCYLVQNIIDKHRLHIGNSTQKSGQVYIADRTKEKQLTILKRRMREFELLMQYCSDDAKKDVFRRFQMFAWNRKQLIEKFSFGAMAFLIKNNRYYSSKLGLITDAMYSLNMEKLLLFVYSRL